MYNVENLASHTRFPSLLALLESLLIRMQLSRSRGTDAHRQQVTAAFSRRSVEKVSPSSGC